MRNNEDRIGISDRNTGAEAPASIPNQEPQQQSSPLSFISPTEFVELPSRGKFYPPEHPLHNVDVIEIKHMTTREEDILTSPALLKKGKALDRFIAEIIVDKRIDPESLVVGDKNAVFIGARISGYGPIYETQVACPMCQEMIDHQFDLEDARVADSAEEILNQPDVSATDNGTYIISNLPATNWSVEVRPLNGRDEKKLAASIEARRKQRLPEDSLVTQMSAFIVSIEGITDIVQIKEAVLKMPAKDARKLRTIYQKIMPNIDVSQTFSCSECSYSGEMEVPFTTDFFWPKQ